MAAKQRTFLADYWKSDGKTASADVSGAVKRHAQPYTCGSHQEGSTTSTAAPRTRPPRRALRASLASSSEKGKTSVRTGTLGARAKNSSPSRRVRLATERTHRSP